MKGRLGRLQSKRAAADETAQLESEVDALLPEHKPGGKLSVAERIAARKKAAVEAAAAEKHAGEREKLAREQEHLERKAARLERKRQEKAEAAAAVAVRVPAFRSCIPEATAHAAI